MCMYAWSFIKSAHDGVEVSILARSEVNIEHSSKTSECYIYSAAQRARCAKRGDGTNLRAWPIAT